MAGAVVGLYIVSGRLVRVGTVWWVRIGRELVLGRYSELIVGRDW